MNLNDMGRDALVIYLKDVFDLETMKVVLTQNIREGDAKLNKLRQKYLTPNTRKAEKPKSGCMKAVLIYLLVAIGLLLLAGIPMLILSVVTLVSGQGSVIIDGIDSESVLSVVGSVLPVAVIIGTILLVLYRRKSKYNDEKKQVDEYNTADSERIKQNAEWLRREVEIPWENQKVVIRSAYAEVCDVLGENYSLNIIPLQCRNLASMRYLYEFMSTSQLSFGQAVKQAQDDETKKQILQKLDIIIDQNERQLRELYAIRKNTETIIKQQRAILAAQVATAYYTRQSALHQASIDSTLKGIKSDYDMWKYW